MLDYHRVMVISIKFNKYVIIFIWYMFEDLILQEQGLKNSIHQLLCDCIH